MGLLASGQFRRSGQRDERRRRLLSDETLAATGSAKRHSAAMAARGSAPDEAQRLSAHYGDALFMDDSLRLLDLVPRKLTTFAFWLLGGLTIILGLEALHAWMADLAPMTTDGRVAAFDLDGEGSLAVWFSSVTLLLSSVVAVMIYTVRRHKSDDYQGRYRIWLWAALCWLLMSIDETSSLHEGFMAMMKHATGVPKSSDGSVWWVVPYFFLLGAVGLRLLLDMRTCKLSTTALVIAASGFGVAVGTQLFGDGLARAVMLEEGSEMTADLFLLLAMGLHARYVILDAEGLLPARGRRSADDFAEEEESYEYEEECEERPASSKRWVKVDTAHDFPKPSRKRRAAISESELQEAAPVQRKMTKQERKALRKRLTKERLESEQKQRDRWGKGGSGF